MIKYLIMDVDGTLTDGRIYMGNDGEAFKCFHVKDGYGIAELCPRYGIIPVIMTGRKSELVHLRAEELGIKDVRQGIRNKLEALNEFLKEKETQFDSVAYIGDDLPDLDCIKKCGYSGCPSDAVKEVKEAVDYICENNGGAGAVREFIEMILTKNDFYKGGTL